MTATTLGIRIPELWAGVECTVNRVGHSYSDQLERSGHALRIKDLERMAELGVRRLRLTPIAGLIHHGSAPRYTNLLDPEFPEKLAWKFHDAFADSVEKCFPGNEMGL